MVKQWKSKKDFKIRSQNILDFRLDTLDIYGEFLERNEAVDHFIGGEFLANNNYKLLDFDYELSTKARKYKYKLIFSLKGKSCIEYLEGTKYNAVFPETKNTIRVNGIAWRILWEKKLFEILDTYFKPSTFMRQDIAIDVLHPIRKVLSHFAELKQAGTDFYDSQWDVETHYIWKYKKSQNRYKLIRIYDKLRDIKHNNNQEFYTDYLTHRDVTRIEIEFRIELCKNVTYEQAKDKQFIKDLFCTHIAKHTDIFTEFQKNKISLTRAKKSISLDELSPEEILTSQRLKMFTWLAYNILKSWVDPIRILTEKKIYQDDTMTDIALATEDGIFSLDSFNTQVNIHNTKNIFKM